MHLTHALLSHTAQPMSLYAAKTKVGMRVLRIDESKVLSGKVRATHIRTAAPRSHDDIECLSCAVFVFVRWHYAGSHAQHTHKRPLVPPSLHRPLDCARRRRRVHQRRRGAAHVTAGRGWHVLSRRQQGDFAQQSNPNFFRVDIFASSVRLFCLRAARHRHSPWHAMSSIHSALAVPMLNLWGSRESLGCSIDMCAAYGSSHFARKC